MVRSSGLLEHLGVVGNPVPRSESSPWLLSRASTAQITLSPLFYGRVAFDFARLLHELPAKINGLFATRRSWARHKQRRLRLLRLLRLRLRLGLRLRLRLGLGLGLGQGLGQAGRARAREALSLAATA